MSISKFLDENRKRRLKIAVVGDAIIDEYYQVEADRVSPEFPIPVMSRAKTEPDKVQPGGAANVAYQLSKFNVEVKLLSILDTESRFIMQEYGIDTTLSVPPYWIHKNFVPRKARYYNGDFALCRIDIESPNYGMDPKSRAKFINKDCEYEPECPYDPLTSLQDALERNLDSYDPDVIILSDYGKGVFNGRPPSERWFKRPIPTIVDPKNGPISRWKGCTIIKPNSKEAEKLSGRSDWYDQIMYFKRETGAQVVITQEGRGFVCAEPWYNYKCENKVVANSVIGAGDAFISFLAMGIGHELMLHEAALVAFRAGSLYVQKKYNTPISVQELTPDKYVLPEDLIKRDYKLVLANGCWDILHPGHISTLEFAKSKGDKLLVAVNTDNSVSQQNKSHPLVNSLESRMKMLAALECVDFVIPFDEETPLELIQKIKPDVLVKGSDWKDLVGSDIVKEVYSAPIVEGLSTTNIIQRIKKL